MLQHNHPRRLEPTAQEAQASYKEESPSQLGIGVQAHPAGCTRATSAERHLLEALI